MANPVLTFPLTPDQWQQAKSLVQEKLGLTLTDDSGTASTKGVTISYHYAANGTLTLQVLHRAFYDPSVDTLDQDITSAIQQIIQPSS